MPTYGMNHKIEDNSPLASLFNATLKKLDLVRITGCPRTFRDLDDQDTAANSMLMFYTAILYEKWMHATVERLNTWQKETDEYLNDYQGSWKYYACAKRIEAINEYGGDESDYDQNGNIITQNLTNEKLKPYTITNNLNPEGIDIVQETTPQDLTGLATTLELHARITPTQLLELLGLPKAQPYKIITDNNGTQNIIPITNEDIELKKITDSVNGEYIFKGIKKTCENINQICKKIRKMNPFQDNITEITHIRNIANFLLECDFDKVETEGKTFNGG